MDSDDNTQEASVSRAHCLQLPEYSIMQPLMVRSGRNSQRVRALAYNSQLGELASLSLNAYVHIWDAQRMTQVNTMFTVHALSYAISCRFPDYFCKAVFSKTLQLVIFFYMQIALSNFVIFLQNQ